MIAIELAPSHKVGLRLANPVMPAAGCYGFGTSYARLIETESLGALVFGPVTARPRRGADPPRTVPFPGGVLLHTGLGNPGVASVARRIARAWGKSATPALVHVAGTTPDEVAACCRRLASVEAVAGVELGLPDATDPAEVVSLVRAAADTATQPLIVRLPLADADLLCEAAVEAGANALTIAAPPRGTVWHAQSGRFITGRLYGPFVLPLALRALRRVGDRIAVPLIGCGGVHNAEDARAMLHAGASAVQVDGALWRDPACLAHIAQKVVEKET